MVGRKMKRLLLTLAGIACLATTAPLADEAMAQGRGHGREKGHERGDERRTDDRRRDTRPALGYERRDDRRGRWDDEAPRYEGRWDDGPGHSARRRGFAPDSYRGAVVEDYRRYRLRPPPHGYAWVRMGDGFALISLDDGQIFDRVR